VIREPERWKVPEYAARYLLQLLHIGPTLSLMIIATNEYSIHSRGLLTYIHVCADNFVSLMWHSKRHSFLGIADLAE
jgi:hypothetical protein